MPATGAIPIMKSLQAEKSQWAQTLVQKEKLQGGTRPAFVQKLKEQGLFPLQATAPAILQVNMGKMCNQVCRHCHVDAGPDRKEIMTREVMELCLQALRQNPGLETVDLTGGAPEMNPHFAWFVENIHALGRQIIVRCNLTIIVANPRFHYLPQFYKDHGVEVVSSLPFYTADRTDRQRGNGVFQDSIRALSMLNAVGYGMPGTGLQLNLVYNPAGAFLPASQTLLQAEYKKEMEARFGIQFNSLFVITNMPISRYLTFLIDSGNYDKYMDKLLAAYNPAAVAGVMCRNTISVGWEGTLYDCDFNQMLDLPVQTENNHIAGFSLQDLTNRQIVLGNHCFGCTAGAGSSCGGATV